MNCGEVRKEINLGQLTDVIVRETGKGNFKHGGVIYEFDVSLREISKYWNCFLVPLLAGLCFFECHTIPKLDHMAPQDLFELRHISPHHQLSSSLLLLSLNTLCTRHSIGYFTYFLKTDKVDSITITSVTEGGTQVKYGSAFCL